MNKTTWYIHYSTHTIIIYIQLYIGECKWISTKTIHSLTTPVVLINHPAYTIGIFKTTPHCKAKLLFKTYTINIFKTTRPWQRRAL